MGRDLSSRFFFCFGTREGKKNLSGSIRRRVRRGRVVEGERTGKEELLGFAGQHHHGRKGSIGFARRNDRGAAWANRFMATCKSVTVICL